ncbi:farnesol dehydrogenase-like, partial [Musca vetustissima]|uniref:farnesol dehydrogenase-like n=1 Tax=Musca vetustissima TaxID=27455 RepID=UPI002AB76850
MSSKLWKSKVAVVTGASVGIGAEIALRLANAGITVIGLARRSELIDDLNKQVHSDGAQIHSYRCDMAKEENIAEVFKWIGEHFGGISILICNAGILKANFIVESSNADLKELYDINAYATTLCLREGIKLMRNGKVDKGHIIVLN